MIWYDSDFDEEIGFPVAEWMLNSEGKPMLGPDDPVAKAVHGVMSRLTQVEFAQGLNIKTCVLDDMEQRRASAGPGKDGDRIFITTAWLSSCMSMDDISGVLAHEVAHLVARHVIERRTTKLFATEIAKWFGFTGALGNDLVQSRMHELEAYHMGLLIMAQRTDAHNVTPCLLSLGEKARVHLKKRKAEDYMKPEALLKRIEDRMSRLELTLVVLMEANKNVKLDGVKQQALAETTDSLVAVNEAKVSTSK
ncbi:hypothetical protein IFR04_002490 [Cadophora malorum]|uniref:Peptidase M48 domain-containing protein n=1 Tax=Cadophora malorum TaxID=108018 RepID=A0A8H8BUR7_9HELO|nr:hypothetical protein IFR04_002490 [Cadophora malorum]